MAEPKKTPSRKKFPQGTDPKLPWWVEILFVQIGLPDYFLRTSLKLKRSSKKFINNNKRYIKPALLIVALCIYTSPIIKRSHFSNICIILAQSELEKNQSSNALKGVSSYKSLVTAHNICNGGTLK
tara:strand:- start:266 stop:643 length:378 start_codon:yes stop_codon:yes gene_type:complete